MSALECHAAWKLKIGTRCVIQEEEGGEELCSTPLEEEEKQSSKKRLSSLWEVRWTLPLCGKNKVSSSSLACMTGGGGSSRGCLCDVTHTVCITAGSHACTRMCAHEASTRLSRSMPVDSCSRSSVVTKRTPENKIWKKKVFFFLSRKGNKKWKKQEEVKKSKWKRRKTKNGKKEKVTTDKKRNTTKGREVRKKRKNLMHKQRKRGLLGIYQIQ